MSHKIQNKESCEVSQEVEQEQARTLLELVTDMYNALEKEKRLVAGAHPGSASSLDRPPSRREGAS